MDMRTLSKKHFVILVVALLGVSALIVYALSSQARRSFPEEALFLDRYTVEYAPGQSNPTVLTLWIGNSATQSANLTSLTVADVTGGNQVSFQFAGPSIPPAATPVSVTVDTGSSGFYFVVGHSYTFTVVTARNNQWQFAAIQYN